MIDLYLAKIATFISIIISTIILNCIVTIFVLRSSKIKKQSKAFKIIKNSVTVFLSLIACTSAICTIIPLSIISVIGGTPSKAATKSMAVSGSEEIIMALIFIIILVFSISYLYKHKHQILYHIHNKVKFTSYSKVSMILVVLLLAISAGGANYMSRMYTSSYNNLYKDVLTRIHIHQYHKRNTGKSNHPKVIPIKSNQRGEIQNEVYKTQ